MKLSNNFFNYFFNRYQIKIESSMKGSIFIFDFVTLLHYKCRAINFKRGGSYIDSPDWIKKKKATINSINKNKKKIAFNMLQQSHEIMKKLKKT